MIYIMLLINLLFIAEIKDHWWKVNDPDISTSVLIMFAILSIFQFGNFFYTCKIYYKNNELMKPREDDEDNAFLNAKKHSVFDFDELDKFRTVFSHSSTKFHVLFISAIIAQSIRIVMYCILRGTMINDDHREWGNISATYFYITFVTEVIICFQVMWSL